MKLITNLFFLVFLTVLVNACKKSPDPAAPKSSQKEITSPPTVTGISGASSSYDPNTATFTITVPANTDVKALVLSMPLSAGATISPNPATAKDYTNPVTYTVTAEDGTIQKYIVKVVAQAAPKSTDKQITAFVFAALSPAVSASIDQSSRKITATVPSTTNLTSLAPTLTLSAKATVSPASGVAQNFTNPVSYTVTAEDGSSQIYEVKVDKAAVVSNNVPCLLTRIEDVANANSYVAFEYTADGRVSKMTSVGKFGAAVYSFEYNQSGDVTKWIKPDGYHDELSYTNGKLTSWKLYRNGALVTGAVNVTNGEYIGNIGVNEANELVKYRSDKLEYTNGNLTKYEYYDGPQKQGGYRIEYDSQKHHLAANKSRGIFGALYYFSRLIGDYALITNPSTSLVNNPTRLTTEDGLTATYTYVYNASGFPTQVEISTPISPDKIKLKYTYSNCQ